MASMCLFAHCAAKAEECWKRVCAKKAFGGVNRLGREKMRRAGKIWFYKTLNVYRSKIFI